MILWIFVNIQTSNQYIGKHLPVYLIRRQRLLPNQTGAEYQFLLPVTKKEMLIFVFIEMFK